MRCLSLLIMLIPLVVVAQSSEETILTGKLNRSAFDQPWAIEWKQAERDYKPDSLIIEKLKSYPGKLSFAIVLGTWCSDSRDMVPLFFKIAEICGFNYELIGVNREKECPQKDCSTWDFTFVPTIVVLKEGKEIGRIVETVKVSVEKDLWEMVK